MSKFMASISKEMKKIKLSPVEQKFSNLEEGEFFSGKHEELFEILEKHAKEHLSS